MLPLFKVCVVKFNQKYVLKDLIDNKEAFLVNQTIASQSQNE